MTTKRWFNTHSLCGVLCGLLLFVVCWSGTFAIISHELDWLATPEMRHESQAKTIAWDDIYENVKQGYPSSRVQWIEAPLYTNASAVAVIDTGEERRLKIYTNPYTGEISGQSSYFTIQRFFRSFHMSLFDVGAIGYWIIYILSLVFLVSIISALVFYKNWWRQLFRAPRGSGRKLWGELHKSCGAWGLIFSLVIGVTALWYLIEASRAEVDGIYSYVGDPSYSIHPVPMPSSDDAYPNLQISTFIEQTKQLRPDITIKEVNMDYEKGTLTVQGLGANMLVRERANHIVFDWSTGEVLYNQNASDLPLYFFINNIADPLHFGNFAGLASKLVYFIFSLMLCFSILSGTYLYAYRILRKAGDRSDKTSVMISVIATLAVFLAATHAGWQELMSYGPIVEGLRQAPSVSISVGLILGAWIITTLVFILAICLLLLKPQTLSLGKQRRAVGKRVIKQIV